MTNLTNKQRLARINEIEEYCTVLAETKSSTKFALRKLLDISDPIIKNQFMRFGLYKDLLIDEDGEISHIHLSLLSIIVEFWQYRMLVGLLPKEVPYIILFNGTFYLKQSSLATRPFENGYELRIELVLMNAWCREVNDISMKLTRDGVEYYSAKFLQLLNSLIKTGPLSKEWKDKHKADKKPPAAKTYLMIDENTGYYKIGKSRSPKARESTLQSEKPTIKLLMWTGADIESALHERYQAKRIRGEWFNLNADDVLDIYEEFKNIPILTDSNQ